MQKKLESSFDTRQYMLSKDYEIFYYNDKSFRSVSAHTHDYYEFYFFLEGIVQMDIEGVRYQLEQGDVIVIPPDLRHHAIVSDSEETPYRRFVFWISREYANRLIRQSVEYGYLLQLVQKEQEYVFHSDVIAATEIQSKVFRLLSEVHSYHFGRDAQIHVCIQDLLISLNRKVYESRNREKEQESLSLYQNILLYIEEHLDEDLSLDALAKRHYVSKYHISHLFKEHAGFSLHRYVLKKRLSLCRDAILTNPGITDLYQQFGFHDYTSFYRAFKKEYGMSPSEFRSLNSVESYGNIKDTVKK